MKRTNIYLDEDQTALLDRRAKEMGTSRAELIRQLLDRSLRDSGDDAAAGLAAIDASFGVASDIEFSGRGDGAREEHIARMWRS